MEALIGRPRTISDAAALERARACIVEHGPGVSLATLSEAVGLSAPALLKRFGSKEQLVFRALLPARPPGWVEPLAAEPGPTPEQVLRRVLLELYGSFVEVGPALAALRMSPVAVDRVFPAAEPGPPVRVRRLLADWLARAGVEGDVGALADLAVGAAEARGFARWVGPQMLDGEPDEAWAARIARYVLRERVTAR